MPSPRVLFVSKPVAPPWHDGSKNLVRDVAAHLERVTPTVMSTEAFARASSLPPRVRVEPVYSAASRFTPPFAANTRVFARLLRGDPLDLWHFIFAPNAASSGAALAAKRVRRLSGFRGPVVQTVASAPRTFEGVSRLLFGDHIIALSEWTRRRLVDAGATRAPIHVIPPCAAAPAEPAEGVVRALRARHDLRGKVVLYPGDYEFSQGARTVVAALPRVLAEVPNLTAVFACRAKTPRAAVAEAELQREVERLGLAPRVRYLGEVPDMPALLRASVVVAFPVDDLYGKVDVPLVLLEALALGVPLVVAAGGPLEELAPAASEVPPGAPERLAAAVVGLLAPGAALEAAKLGRTLYGERFTPSVVARAHDALYERALGVAPA